MRKAKLMTTAPLPHVGAFILTYTNYFGVSYYSYSTMGPQNPILIINPILPKTLFSMVAP